MTSALIVSNTKKNARLFSECLNTAGISQINILHSIGETRRCLLERDIDLIVIDTPLHDESGEYFACDISYKSLIQVILAVNSEHFNSVTETCEKDGVLVISKPVDRQLFWSSVSLARAADAKIKRFQAENTKLKQKIEDIRVIDRAKCLLISYVNLSEQEAHRFIEKQAMDLRCAKLTIAQEIIRTYGN